MTLEQYRQVYKIPAVSGVSHIYINGSSERVKKALKDLVVFTDHHRGRTRRQPQPVPLQQYIAIKVV